MYDSVVDVGLVGETNIGISVVNMGLAGEKNIGIWFLY